MNLSSKNVDFDSLIRQFYENGAYLSRLHVDERYRNNGIGRKLLKAAALYFPHIEKFYLNTLSSNKNAISFYKHVGFVEEFVALLKGKHENTFFSIDTEILT